MPAGTSIPPAAAAMEASAQGGFDRRRATSVAAKRTAPAAGDLIVVLLKALAVPFLVFLLASVILLPGFNEGAIEIPPSSWRRDPLIQTR